jgi:hypothetical protein
VRSETLVTVRCVLYRGASADCYIKLCAEQLIAGVGVCHSVCCHVQCSLNTCSGVCIRASQRHCHQVNF